MRGFNRLGRRSGVNRPYEGSLGTDLGIDSGYRIFGGGDAEAVEALVCKTGLKWVRVPPTSIPFRIAPERGIRWVVNRECLERKISVADDGSRTEMIGFAGD
jgi:hypothetical protein